MGYDPQANRRRPRPATNDPAPVDALLGAAGGAPGAPRDVADDPPPTPAVTPAPADPPPDSVLLKSTLAAIAAVIVVLVAARQLWKHRRPGRRGDADD
jgi:hypothetical protein